MDNWPAGSGSCGEENNHYQGSHPGRSAHILVTIATVLFRIFFLPYNSKQKIIIIVSLSGKLAIAGLFRSHFSRSLFSGLP
jgi:hypothetical protein